jgi:hypothetical protein
MPATFAPITDRTDRPRLFDDRPPSRARRPARRQPPVAPRDPAEPTGAPSEPLFPLAPERAPREPDTTARGPVDAPERAPREPDTTARGPLGAPTAPAPHDTAPAPHDTAPAPHHHDHARDRPHDGGGSLDDLIRGVWDELSSHRTVTCPVCHGQMAPRYGSAEQPVGGRCRRCGSSLG